MVRHRVHDDLAHAFGQARPNGISQHRLNSGTNAVLGPGKERGAVARKTIFFRAGLNSRGARSRADSS